MPKVDFKEKTGGQLSIADLTKPQDKYSRTFSTGIGKLTKSGTVTHDVFAAHNIISLPLSGLVKIRLGEPGIWGLTWSTVKIMHVTVSGAHREKGYHNFPWKNEKLSRQGAL